MSNDRLKFRVWDKHYNKYLNDRSDVAITQDGKLMIETLDGLDEIDPSGETFVVEQCTGRKDKNGRLIYEGDIISGSNGSINGRYWTFKQEIKWDEKKGFSVPKWGANEDWSHWYEVIGNIHENPELLEAAK